MTPFLIAAGGFLGAITRYFISIAWKPIWSDKLPIATLSVNLTGSFFLGILIGGAVSSDFMLFFGIGFLGSYTTYSTFMVENVRMIIDGKWKIMMIYLLLSFVGGMILAFAGIMLGMTIKS